MSVLAACRAWGATMSYLRNAIRGLAVSVICIPLAACAEDAKPALEAVAYILFDQGISDSKNPRFSMKIEGEKAMLEGLEPWQIGQEQVTIRQESACKYTISGQNFQDDELHPFESSVDFSNAKYADAKIFEGQTESLGMNLPSYTLEIHGIDVCTKLATPRFEGWMKNQGDCVSFLSRSLNSMSVSRAKSEAQLVLDVGKKLAATCKPNGQ
jgi:hypothetical protein